jgi:glycosyltransferase involved in cell wall biosynthesis
MLEDAIDSINKQSFPHENMEIIFVDDGSEDHTVQIILDRVSTADIGTKVIRTKWQGLGSARNLIVKNAAGDYVIWVDADEVLSDNYVEKQVEFMKKNPEVGITTGAVKTVPNNLVLSLELMPEIVNRMKFGKPKNFIWKTEKMPGTGGATYRVKALREVNGFDEQLKGVGEDQDVAHRITNAGWLIRLNNAPFYEFHGGMSTILDLWKKYVWYGRGGQKIYCQNRKLFSLPRMSPLASFLTGFFYSLAAYRMLHQKKAFLLPIHYSIKMLAWASGFMEGQMHA